MKTNHIIAGIVSYNPEIGRLNENINAIMKQVEKVIIIDNNSRNIQLIESTAEKCGVDIIKNFSNDGIGKALNQMLKYAFENGYEWCVTLDQDSVVPHNLIAEAERWFSHPKVGQIVPMLYESNTGETCYLGVAPNGERYQEVNKSITSAAITNVSIWEKIGGFDEKLFIDYIDYDYAIKLRKNGNQIIRMNNVILDHHIGDSSNKKFLCWRVRVGNHSAFRKYYIARNIVIYIRRYNKEICVIAELLRLLKVIALLILYEENKFEKLKEVFKGILDGLKYDIKYQ